MSEAQTIEIINVLKSLPPEKIAEVRDFVMSLRERHSKTELIDESDEWTDEDLRDFSAASFRYAQKFEKEDDF